jgi:hypothetical protein
MAIFKIGAIHTMRVSIKLLPTNEHDEEDQAIIFWLVDSEGNKYDIMQDTLEIGDKKFYTLFHITKKSQELSFTMKMPDKPGDYTLQTNVNDKSLTNNDRQIRLVE